KQKVASVAFESRSRRGVGRATLEFDTRTGHTYRMEGGAKELHFAGEVCDLEETFFLESDTNDTRVAIRFSPQSRDGDYNSYSGTMTGNDDQGKKYTFPVHGKGKYDIKYDGDTAVGIDANGPGTVETPYGPLSAEGREKYTLKPLGDQPCVG